MPLDLTGIDVAGINSLFPQKPKRNPVVAGLSSGVDQLQGLGYNALAAGADALGLERGRDWLLERAARNEAEAYASGRPDLEMVEDQDLGTAIPFAAYQIAKQVPQIGAALSIGALTGGAGLVPAGLARGAATLPTVVGGGGLRAGADFAARRAALQAGQRFGQNLTGGAVLGAGMGVGDMYGESVEAGDPSPYKAFAASPLYALAEGLPTAVLGNTLARGAFSGGLGTRMAKAGAVNAGAGALSELGQEELVMGFNPNLTPEEVASRRLNAAVIGGLAEGAFGSLGGLRRPPQPVNLLPGANPGVDSNFADLNRLSDTAAGGTQGSLFTDEQAPLNQFSAFPRAVNDTVPVDQLNDLLDQRGILFTLMQRAEQANDAKTFYAAQSALNQLTPQIDVLQQQVDRATAGGYQRQMSLPLTQYAQGDQITLFPGGAMPAPAAPVEPLPAAVQDTQTLDMFEQSPTAMVRTEFAVPQIRAALRNANGGKLNAQLQRFVPEFARAVERGPEAVNELIAKYDTNRSTLKPEVFETAYQMALDYQSRMTNAMAQEGLSRARPGTAVGTAPASNATEMEMRAANQGRAEQERLAADAQRAQAQLLDEQETRTLEAMIQDEADLRDLESQIPERKEKLSPGGQRRLFTNREMGRVIPNQAPETEAPVEVDQSRQRKLFDSKGRPILGRKPIGPDGQRSLFTAREMGDVIPNNPPVEAEVEPEDTRPVRQGELFTKKGEPTAKADQQPEKRKPRKSKVKAKVGEQEVELEVDNVDEKIASMRADIDKYKAFVACLRKK